MNRVDAARVPAAAPAVGALGAHRIVTVDARGALAVPDARLEIDWLVGAADRWRRPATDASVRQHRQGGSPGVETRLAVPGGDVVHQVYGVAGPVPLAIVEVRNDSAEAVALAVVVRGSAGHPARHLHGANEIVTASGEPVLIAARAPQHVATARDEAALLETVTANATTAGAAFDVHDRRRGVTAALVWALPHRTGVRVGVPLTAGGARTVTARDITAAPDAASAQRGWALQLERGLRIDHDDAALVELVDAARAQLAVLAGADRPRPTADVAVACEDWGFDAEALTAWSRLSVRERRAAAQRDPQRHVDAWTRLRGFLQQAGTGPTPHAARLLRALHDVVLHESDDRIDLLPGFPLEWLGQNVAVHDAPTRRGPISFALRWHGPRPALLWSAPPGVALHAPRLDPAWHAGGGDGDVLLDAPPAELMALGTPRGDASTSLAAEPGDSGTFL